MLLNCGGREDLRVSWTAIQTWRKSTLHIIGRTDGEAEAPILWPPDAKSWFTGKDPDAGIDWGQEEKTEDEIVGWHHWFDGHEFEQSPGDGIPGQGCLVWCVGAVRGVTKRQTGQQSNNNNNHEANVWCTNVCWAMQSNGTQRNFNKQTLVGSALSTTSSLFHSYL